MKYGSTGDMGILQEIWPQYETTLVLSQLLSSLPSNAKHKQQCQ